MLPVIGRDELKSILAALALIATASASAVAITNGNSDGPVQGSSAPATAAEDRDIEEARRAFLEDEVAPRVEPAAFNTTIIMYTDYQCPYCRKAHVALKELLSEDSKVRILYRDWPIFGPASEQAARLAIASKWQDRHTEFHDALMRTPGKLSDETIRTAAKKAGVDWAQLEFGSEDPRPRDRGSTPAQRPPGQRPRSRWHTRIHHRRNARSGRDRAGGPARDAQGCSGRTGGKGQNRCCRQRRALSS